jgi:hypothetical protein
MSHSFTDSAGGKSHATGIAVRKYAFVRLLLLISIVAVTTTTSFCANPPNGLFAFGALPVQTQTTAGPNVPVFDLGDSSIPVEEIRHGGPPKDGIPALSTPTFLTVDEADYLSPEDRVICIKIGDEARAYPLRILEYHEIVNDVVEDMAVAVTYCPLCDSAAVFDRSSPQGVREFGVSGLLYNSNVLMYDRTDETESLWSQIRSAGVSGPGVGVTLKALPLELTTWADWSVRHPETLVLSLETGHRRNYQNSIYRFYFRNNLLLFPVSVRDERLETKAPVLGVWTDEGARAFPLSAFEGETQVIEGDINGAAFKIEYRAESNSLRMVDADEGVQWMYAFWFAWYAFHPDTTVYSASHEE